MDTSNKSNGLVIISPHLDDAVFGCGDLMANCPGSIVITAFAGKPPQYEPFTEWDTMAGFKPGDDVLEIRKAEDREALALLNAKPIWLDFCDAQYKCSPTVHQLAEVLEQAILSCKEKKAFIPMGLYHSDHKLVHAASMLVYERHTDIDWYIYAEAIYRGFPSLLDEGLKRLALQGFQLTDTKFDVGRSPRKRMAVECYKSQIKAIQVPGKPGLANIFERELYWKLSS